MVHKPLRMTSNKKQQRIYHILVTAQCLARCGARADGSRVSRRHRSYDGEMRSQIIHVRWW